ncbi:MAG TPA: 1-deoxy-D-xylulose-5-phosphate synthase, partial [Acidimicrobiales bacterium]|nr:1-deoxy-D-xylulose-5-phosphate synthase [Acidimicrobiales bacterium]
MTLTLGPRESLLLGAGSRQALRGMDRRQLGDLGEQIRAHLVETLSVTGGHLGSNLGVVELTIALHRVFDSPTDAIVWDTGHQAYVHKILTGRLGAFPTLRQPGGLSGYPNRAESSHDLVENSHASTALSYAYGLAAGRRQAGLPGCVVAVVGDGALTGGLAYEALNNIGTRGLPVVVVLNDNGRSYAPTVSRLAGPQSGRRAAAFFEALGLAYAGVVDGHDVEALEAELVQAASATGPVVVHVRTTKGKGYGPAEEDEDKCLHDVGPFDPLTGRPPAAVPARLSYTDAFAHALVAEAARHPGLVAITAAMAGPTGLGEFASRYPDRFFDCGIAEQHAVTAAAGMAMAGLRPVVAVYSTFLNRAWDQVYYDVGLHRLPVVFCLDRAGVTGDDGPSHHGSLDLMLLTKVPGMTVMAPSSHQEVGEMLATALAQADGPVAIRWPKTAAMSSRICGAGLGARKLADGGDACLLGVGKLVEACLEAAVELAAEGVRASVWDVRLASPLDPAMLADAMGHPVVVTAEDGIAA